MNKIIKSFLVIDSVGFGCTFVLKFGFGWQKTRYSSVDDKTRKCTFEYLGIVRRQHSNTLTKVNFRLFRLGVYKQSWPQGSVLWLRWEGCRWVLRTHVILWCAYQSHTLGLVTAIITCCKRCNWPRESPAWSTNSARPAGASPSSPHLSETQPTGGVKRREQQAKHTDLHSHQCTKTKSRKCQRNEVRGNLQKRRKKNPWIEWIQFYNKSLVVLSHQQLCHSSLLKR